MIYEHTKHYTFSTMQKGKDGADGNDLDALVRTMFGESRGESEEGRIAVAQVIRNRACIAWDRVHNGNGREHPLYGDGSLYSACHKPWQFSCWNPDDENHFKVTALPRGGPVYQALRLNALTALNNDDITGGATHYHEIHLKPYPSWTRGATETVRIENHVFYTKVP